MIETRTVIQLACPAELNAPIGAKPVAPADATLTGNEAGMAWLGNVVAWANALLDRLADAREDCARG